MRIALLALLVLTASSCKKQDAALPVLKPIKNEAFVSKPQTPPKPIGPKEEFIRRVRAKSGPEYLDELIQRTGSITLNKFFEKPDYYFGYPLAIQGKVSDMQHVGGGHVFSLVVPANIGIAVMGEKDIDFSNDEEVDVVGYFFGFNKANYLMIWSHSILRKGAVAQRRKELKILNRLPD